jgi:hypothetical protein
MWTFHSCQVPFRERNLAHKKKSEKNDSSTIQIHVTFKDQITTMAPTNSAAYLVNSDGSFWRLSVDGVLEAVLDEERTMVPSINRVGITQNPASSVSNGPTKTAGEQTGLVGTDVHGTRLYIRARI